MAVEQITDIYGTRFWLLEIPKDGNCLFGSVVHQVHGITPTHHLFEPYKRQLREAAVNELIGNFEFYADQLVVFADEAIEGDISVESKVRRYLEELWTDGTWVGADCIAAICNLQQIAITVYQDNGKIEFTPTRSENEDWPLYAIFYKDLVNGARTHYDSVVCIRPLGLPPFELTNLEAERDMLSNETTIADSVRIGDVNQSVFTALHHQLTRKIPTEEELNIYRGLVVSELGSQSGSFLANFGIPSGSDFGDYLFDLRIGRHDGGPATLCLISSLFKVKIYVHSASRVSERLEPAEADRGVVLHIFERRANNNSVYASIVYLEHLHPHAPIQSRRRSMPDSMAIANKVAREQLSSQETIDDVVLVLPSHGLRVASLNVNGCRTRKKRDAIDEYLLSRCVHVAALQEVNLDCLHCLTSNYKWYMGAPSGSRKRGLAILVRRGLDVQLFANKDYGANVQHMKIVYQV